MRNSYLLKKAVLTAALFSGGLTVLNAQTTLSAISRTVARTPGQVPQWNGNTGNFEPCPSARLTNQYIIENGLQNLAAMGQLERQNTSTEEPTDRVVRTVPVVFHIVYGTTAENVSDAVINELLERLNEDFRKNNSLIPGIRAAFAPVASDVQIEFCLATKDPNGNTMATPGITRRQTTLTYFDSDNPNDGINYAAGGVGGPNAMKGATYGEASWDRTKYVNIWICDITNGAQSGTAGYAYMPQGTTTPGLPPAAWDGIVLDYNIGVQGGQSRAVSHEMGHFFGLDHTFSDNGGFYGDGQSACGPAVNDDGFTDTPRIRGPFQNNYASCASATTVQSCTSGQLWQYENLMDYSNCFCMFTTQQANHMNAVLSGSRSSLTTSTVTNCSITPVAPVANFSGCNSSVAQGSTVTFTDASTGVPTSWSWSITPATGWSYVGGTSATSQNPQVQFTALGTYNVSLTATNAQGSNTKTSNSCITVVTAPACNNLATPLVMGFEASDSTALLQWLVENTNGDVNSGGDPNTWGLFQTQTGLTAHGGTRMIGYLYNDDGVTAANDWFYTPCLALQAGTTYSLSFWHMVGSSGGTTYPERLRVKVGNTANSAAMTQTIVDLGTLTNTGWVQSTSTFTVSASGNYNIGFQCYSLADEFFLMVDDINISAQTAVQPPVANFTGCTNITTGNTVTFTNTSTNSPTSYSWSITPGTGWSYAGGTNASSANPQVTFTAAGTYTVALTATNSAGSNTKTSSNCVTVTAGAVAPVANFTGCGSYTVGNIVTFTNTSTNSPTSYSWSITPATGWFFAGGTNASSANPQVVFTSAGSYTVALTATNSAGNNTKTSSNCVVATVAAQAPVADFSGCGNFSTGSTVTFTNTSTNSPTSYSWSVTPATGWSFAGGTNATSPNPQITFTAAGTYTVALTATNSAGSNTKTSSSCVVVSNGAVTPAAGFTGCGTYTTGSTVTLTNTSTNSPTSYSWSITPGTGWSYTGGTSATSANPQITFTANGSYTISLTAGNSAGNNTTTSNGCVVISTTGIAPQADFIGCPGTVAAGSTVTFANTSINQPTSYLWQIVPGTGWTFVGGTTATSASIQVQFTAVGPYSVSLTATNAQGNDTKTVQNCVSVQSVGINEVADFAAGINLYPNPSTGMATLHIGAVSNYSNLSVTVYNTVGVQVYKTSGNVPSELTLDLTGYSAGIYLVEVRANEAVATKRLIISQ